MANDTAPKTTNASFAAPTVDVRVGVPGSTPAPDRLAGTPYRLVGPLGHGGMAEVLESEHVRTGARVALKLLHHEYAGHPALADRLRIEAEVLTNLEHPNLVRVHGLGQAPYAGGYIVMERLFGRTLRDEVRVRGALPPLEAIGYVRQALAGLALVHRAGIVHRDLKLDNLFLCDPAPRSERDEAGSPATAGEAGGCGNRVLKILDFGIAKLLDEPKVGASGRASLHRRTRSAISLPVARLQFPTEAGVCIGTPRFASPEQAIGKPVDARADLYALGVVLYTLITGRGLFEDLVAPGAILDAQLRRQPPPPSTYAPGSVPKELDAVVLRALAKNPADRFPNAEAFAEALDDIILGWNEVTDASAPAVRVFAMVSTPPVAPASGIDDPPAFGCPTRLDQTIELTHLDPIDALERAPHGVDTAAPPGASRRPGASRPPGAGASAVTPIRRVRLTTAVFAACAFVSGGLIALAIAQLLT